MPANPKLPPAPAQTKMFDAQGNLTVAWLIWFREVYNVSLAVEELEAELADIVAPRDFLRDIQAALLESEPATPHDYSPEIEARFLQAQNAVKDYGPEIQDRFLQGQADVRDFSAAIQEALIQAQLDTPRIPVDPTVQLQDTLLQDQGDTARDFSGAIQEALLQDQWDTPRDFSGAIQEALLQNQADTARDFSGAIQEALLTVVHSPVAQVKLSDMDDLRALIAAIDVPQRPLPTLLNGVGTPSGAIGIDVSNASAVNLYGPKAAGVWPSAITLSTSSGTSAAALLKANNLSDLASVSTARTNLGIVDTTNAANITSGTLAAARLPNPTASSLGGVEAVAAVAHQWVASISTAGVPALSQPGFGDLSGTLTASQLPLATTSAAGAVIVGANLSVSSGTISLGTLGAGLNLNGQTLTGTATFSGVITLPGSNLNVGAWASYTPTVTASGSMTVSGVSVSDAQYQYLNSATVKFKVYMSMTLGGTASNFLNITLPVTFVGGTQVFSAVVLAAGASGFTPANAWGGGSGVSFSQAGQVNFALGNINILVSGTYRVA